MKSSPALPRIDVPKVSEHAYQIMREKIVSKEFSPGQRLNLETIERQLGISRTPLKEAMGRLAIEGLVEIMPRSGTYVTNPSTDDIAESFDVRRILEVYAVELVAARGGEEELQALRALVDEMEVLTAAPDRDAIYPNYLSLDHQFHMQLASLSGNTRLLKTLDQENTHAQMARVRYRRSERELNIAQEEHERIMTALEARDMEAAGKAMDAHLQRAKRSILDDMARAER
jgi:GntR family transcriptional regulator, rspAB operon transcriptional repressor